jgi:murein DD-endopeptidase MepM/ murein hydrolase activator NlpD
LIDRAFQRGRRAGGKRGGDQAGPIHVEDLTEAHDDPFDTTARGQSRWLLSACVAGIAGSLVVGGTLIGLFGNARVSTVALASVQPGDLLQRPQVTLKGNLDDNLARAAGPRALKEMSVAYQGEDSTRRIQELVVPQRIVTGSIGGLYPAIAVESLPYGPSREPTVLDASLQNASFTPANITTIAKTPPPEPVDEVLTLARGDTLIDQLVDLGVTRDTARSLASAIEPVYPSRLMKAGQIFTVTLDRQQDFYGNDVIYPVRVAFATGTNEEITVEADEDGQFVARVGDGGSRQQVADAPHYRVAGKISSSLYAAAQDEGVPEYIVSQMMRVFSYDVDFQRQIHPGDEFEVFYGSPLTGSSKNRKVIHYTLLSYGGQKKAYYRFTTPDDGVTAYYDENGRSATKFLMRTPINGARITSGYGMRRHPLLGYSKMHTGIDFGLPYGTPIHAAGNGVISLAGRAGAYGKTVRIKHANGYETLYAHMSRIASGIDEGIKVNQGQVIGYVGSTGRSTGPHLHYEVRRNDKPLNPMKVRETGGRQLAGDMLKLFKQHKQQIIALMDEAPTSTKLARAGN